LRGAESRGQSRQLTVSSLPGAEGKGLSLGYGQGVGPRVRRSGVVLDRLTNVMDAVNAGEYRDCAGGLPWTGDLPAPKPRQEDGLRANDIVINHDNRARMRSVDSERRPE